MDKETNVDEEKKVQDEETQKATPGKKKEKPPNPYVIDSGTGDVVSIGW
jgi:hypothetical protein